MNIINMYGFRHNVCEILELPMIGKWSFITTSMLFTYEFPAYLYICNSIKFMKLNEISFVMYLYLSFPLFDYKKLLRFPAIF